MKKAERQIKVTFADRQKKIDMEMIAAVIAKTLSGKGGENNVKRKKVL